MSVFGHPVDRDRFALVISDDAAEISVKFLFPRRRDQRDVVFCAKNDVIQKVSV